ncbi:S1 family peptidase [Nocardia brevicatena]|uniref:S1 family peptidase n=1 Tax=Nocardia brevicatena TaxID=37327 RepID=UPI0003025EAE|nr:serine protease [Nocardia brevicatena]
MSIRDLLRSATAAVARDEPDGERIGTAFRVASGYAVTAAHVVGQMSGDRVRLDFGEGSSFGAAVVAADRPDPAGRWTFEDLAVLRIDEPEAVSAPCVLMADVLPEYDDRLVICALNAVFPPRVLELYEMYRVRETHASAKPPFFTIDGNRAVIRGMSGGPVWSVRHGGVIGFVKASEHIGAAQGGAIACLLDGLRRVCEPKLYDEIVTGHDAYHHRHEAWTDRLVGSAEAVLRRWLVVIHGRLAAITTAEERRVPTALLDTLFDLYPPDTARFVTLRDLAEYVGTETHEPEWGLTRFCVHTAAHLPGDSPSAEGLLGLPRSRGMVSERRSRDFAMLLESARPVTDEVTTLFGVILPEEGPRVDDRSPTPYRIELARKTGTREIVSLDGGGHCVDFADAKEELKRELDRVLRDIYRPKDTVEIVVALPDKHLTEEPLYTWLRPSDSRPFAKFLMRLRRSRTWEKTGEQIAELEDRWELLHRKGVDAMAWFDCVDPRARDLPALQELFVLDDSPAAIAVTEVPSVQVLTAAHSNALPVTLWRNDRCAAHYAPPTRDTPSGPAADTACRGTIFREVVSQTLARVPPAEWYTSIWNNQRGAGSSAHDRGLWRAVIFLLDVPGQSKRRPHPLAGPRSESGVR